MHRTRSLLHFCAALLPSTALAQEHLAVFQGGGSNVADIGDVDGDGTADFVAGMRAVSGRTLKALFSFPFESDPVDQAHEFILGAGDRDGDGYGDIVVENLVLSGRELLFPSPRGSAVIGSLDPAPISLFVLGGVARLDDLDGDGIPELASGWPDCRVSRCPGDHPRFESGTSGGFARIQSSLDGSALLELGAENGFGGVIARLGDLDGDGHPDLGIATRRPPDGPFTPFCSFQEGNLTRAVSSASGSVLWQVQGAPRALAALDDLDSDGVRDVAFGFPYLGRVELRSGRTGALLRAFSDDLLGDGTHLFGRTLFAYPDLDGDGLGELLVSAPEPRISSFPGGPRADGPGHVLILSTRTGRPLVHLHGKATGEEFGMSVAVLTDLDGDGRPEIAVGSSGVLGGRVDVLSPAHASAQAKRVR